MSETMQTNETATIEMEYARFIVTLNANPERMCARAAGIMGMYKTKPEVFENFGFTMVPSRNGKRTIIFARADYRDGQQMDESEKFIYEALIAGFAAECFCFSPKYGYAIFTTLVGDIRRRERSLYNVTDGSIRSCLLYCERHATITDDRDFDLYKTGLEGFRSHFSEAVIEFMKGGSKKA